MFSNLSAGALGLPLDHTTSIDLAARHGFGGVDPDLGHFRTLGGTAAVAEHAAAVQEKGLEWGMAGLPVPLDAPAAEFRQALVDLPESLELLRAAGVTRVGTWMRPMHDDLDYLRNWRLHVSRLALVAELLADAGLRHRPGVHRPEDLLVHRALPVHPLPARGARADRRTPAPRTWGSSWTATTGTPPGRSADDLAGLTDADIVSVDINDARADRERDEQQDLDRRLPYDTGVIDLAGFMGAVHAAGYTGPVKVEPFMKSLAEQPVDDVLADISSRLDRAVTGK